MSKRIGGYELRRTVGCGRYGKVKHCIHLATGKEYAIKILPIPKIRELRMETQLKREIAVMKMINHENVVRLIEILQTLRNVYIVMELCSGGELIDQLSVILRFTEDQARFYFAQLIAGVQYCHDLGIAHRDLKPENLLLDHNQSVLKICDFGLSALVTHGPARMRTMCGTPPYIAPEIIRSHRSYDPFRADIWSCGVVLYLMLEGCHPFRHKSQAGLFRMIKLGDFRRPKYMSREAHDLIKRIFQVNPNRRIKLRGIMKHPWYVGAQRQRGGLKTFLRNIFRRLVRKAQVEEPTEDEMERSIRVVEDVVVMKEDDADADADAAAAAVSAPASGEDQQQVEVEVEGEGEGEVEVEGEGEGEVEVEGEAGVVRVATAVSDTSGGSVGSDVLTVTSDSMPEDGSNPSFVAQAEEEGVAVPVPVPVPVPVAAGPAPPVQFRGRAIGEELLRSDRGMDAFSLVSQFMNGTLSVFATGVRPAIIRRKTRFMGKVPAPVMRDRLFDVFASYNATPTMKDLGRHYCIKGSFRTTRGHIVSIQAIIVSTIVDSICFVEFQRRRGDILDFQRFYRDCHNALVDVIATECEKNRKINPRIVDEHRDITTDNLSTRIPKEPQEEEM